MAQPISEKTKPDADTDSRLQAIEQALSRFLKDNPAKPEVKDNPESGWLQLGEDTQDPHEFKRPPPNLQMLD